jgi:deoxyribodipyrimidine photo-lyase
MARPPSSSIWRSKPLEYLACSEGPACPRRLAGEGPVTKIPAVRIRRLNERPVRRDGDFVVYWMTAFRRLHWNHALQHAADRARELRKPLLILDGLRCGYRWASDRIHRFVLDGMAENARALAGGGILYYPYAEPAAGAGSGLMEALAGRACLVVADDAPIFFLPRMVAAAAARLPVAVEAVDANGLLPIVAAPQVYPTAYVLRRFLQKELPEHLGDLPEEDPLAGSGLPAHPGLSALPVEIVRRWPPASAALLAGEPAALAALPIDHSVPPVAGVRGGEAAAREALERFLDRRLVRYGTGRNDPAEDVTSGLSPYLHFGHISPHEILVRLAEREGWTPARLGSDRRGAKEGWWGMSPPAESFLDELVTWRELGLNMAARRPDYDRWESLPEWARATLGRHAGDPRPEIYTPEDFEAGQTGDMLWNAAQGQLVGEGKIHNYLRMLWGKKVLHWSPSPQEALATLIELNNKYALDGRNPNSTSGIFWCFGRYDRPWAPERPIFGVIRYMSSESTRRKFSVDRYVARWAPSTQGRLAL